MRHRRDVDRAVRSARHASTKWTETSWTTSEQILNHDMLSDHVDELSVLDAGAPFGGFKTSGISKEKGRTAMERKSAPPCVPAINRRQMIAGTVAALAMPAILSLARPAHAASDIALVGAVKPTARPGSDDDLKRLLPSGIELLSVGLNFSKGTKDEFTEGFAAYDKQVAALAEQNCRLVSAEGAPPFMIAGPAKEAEQTAAWEAKYGVPVFTAPQNQVNGLRALGARNILGFTYFPDEMNAIYANYFRAVGLNVVAMRTVDLKGLPFDKVQDIPSDEIFKFIQSTFRETSGADVVYILGSGIQTLDIVDRVEQTLGVPMVQPVAVRAWEMQKRIGIERPLEGYGRLLAEMPPLPV